jgi:imidazolonepropionase-like amidohydrolase
MYYTALMRIDEGARVGLTVINGLVFDGRNADLRAADVELADGAIVAIGEAAQPAEGEVIDARGGTIVPGLIDAHFHAYAVGLDPLWIEASPLSYVALAAARRLGAALRRGFTTVRDPAGGDRGLVRAIEAGLLPAPRYLYMGAALSQTGGHGDARPPGIELCGCGAYMTEVVDGVDPLRRAVRERFRNGAHAIKLMTSGGVVSPSDPIRNPQYSAEEIAAVADEAARRGSYVAAHAYSPEAIAHSVANGVRSVEHGNLLDAPTAELMAERGAYLVPTLAAYDALNLRGAELGLAPVSQAKNSEVLDAGREAIGIARAAGVPVGWGSDLMGDLEDHQLQGLRLQATVDGPLELLRSVTSVNAELLGRDDLGRIAVGASADLVIFAGNPLEDPSLLWAADGRIVIRDGRRV